MIIKEIDDKKVWEDFLESCQEKTFLQSWNWGEFQKMMGNKIWRLGVYDDGGDLISVVLVIKIAAKRGVFLFVPHGPIIKSQISNFKSQILRLVLEKLKEIGREEKADFIRIAPIWERSEENKRIFKEIGFRDSPIHLHPEISWELDIRPAEETLLANMRKTTRYLIRQAEKNSEIEIKIQQTTNAEDLDTFNKLYRETVGRHRFVPFPKDYLKNELLTFRDDNQMALFLGKYRGEIVSSAMVIFWAETAFYHQGASSAKYAKIPVSYLLQWEAIKEAKKRGCLFYNFWGISPIQDKKHPWFGLSQFKMGFGGYQKQYLKTQDLPLSKKYWLIYLFEKLRKIKRGL